jgi:galactokinase
VFRAPGRVNLIGEHTDYTQGFVLPVAIGLECQAASAPSGDPWIRIYADDLGAGTQVHLDALQDARPREDWSDYVIGVARELQRRGYSLTGRNVVIRSAVPQGAGLSSSAALEVATALSLVDVQDRVQLAKLCRTAEADFAGVPCGIMDQFASVFCESGSAMLLDCRTLERKTVKLPEGATLLAVNSGVRHAVGASAYRKRVDECAEALREIRVMDQRVETLRDATPLHLRIEMRALVMRRARHVVTENARVLDFVAAAERADTTEMGRLMNESHASLASDYEVSCPELDALVEAAIQVDGVLGARMTGAGFGGCIVALLDERAVQEFEAKVPADYFRKCGKTAEIYGCDPSAGAGELA